MNGNIGLCKKNSQFKPTYQYIEYHFEPSELIHHAPDDQSLTLAKTHNGPIIIGLVLAFSVSFALSTKKTAYVLRSVFGIPISYQSVLNYIMVAVFPVILQSEP